MLNQKGLAKLLLIVLLIIILALIVVYFARVQNKPTSQSPATSTPSENIFLSADQKNILAGDEVLLVIDNDEIFDFFRNQSSLCDEANINNSPEQQMFCEDKQTFKNKTKFTSIVVSGDKQKVGFGISSEILQPDAVVGIFYPYLARDRIHFLTNYYLGNEFISFSPNDKYFVYKAYCWEAMCGLFVRDSETLEELVSINNPEYLDLRTSDVNFVKWLSDNQMEYELGDQTERVSL
jgi:hypothetical protein